MVARSPYFVLAWILLGCSPPEGWAPRVDTGGPTVRYELGAEPLPEIPLPNDTATRLDPSSPTGRRLNFSTTAPTQHEREVRATFDTLDGFGAYAPIFVPFDAPLDVADLLARHANDDFRDDAVLLVNADPDCARFGEEVALDIGRGRFPATLWSPDRVTPDTEAPQGYRLRNDGPLFPFDDHGHALNMLFEEFGEDLDGDGELDAGEDVDHDGVLDVPNLDDPDACADLAVGTAERDRCIADHLMTFYERETNTLVLRPLWPLEQQCTYAVLLTDRLRGEEGAAVQSPFAWNHHRDQLQALLPLEPLLPRWGLEPASIAFAWTYTVGSMTLALETLRAGLYGEGTMARLADEFPVTTFDPWTRAELAAMTGDEADPAVADHVVLPGACVGESLSWLWGPALGEWDANLCAIEADLSAVGGLFGGTFAVPNLLADKDGIATERYPADNDEVWEFDPVSGEAEYGRTDVTFWCSLPREREDADAACTPGNPDGTPGCLPAPVILYAHGYGGSRGEITLHMGRHNAMGYAMCALDSYGHGLNRSTEDTDVGGGITLALGHFRSVGVPELGALMTRGRDRDLNNDGLSDPGMDMWTSDVFHTRDMIRQSVLEEMQFVRILRAMDGSRRDGDELLGDVDGDGVVDLGGPTNTIGMWGISLGGILSGVAAGAEPGLDAVSPNAGGAGLTDISYRSSQAGVPEAVVLPMLGPIIAGCLPTDEHQRPLSVGEATDIDCLGTGDGERLGGTLRLAAFAQDEASFRRFEIGTIAGVEPGDRVKLENLANGEVAWSRIGARGWFRTSVASDALDPVERRPLLGMTADEPGPRVIPEGREAEFGDPLALTVYAGDSDTVRGVVDRFATQLEFQGTIHLAGTPLIALQEGLGYRRNTPGFRRFIGFAQHGIASADPGVWGAHAFLDPLDVRYDPNGRRGGDTRLLMMPTAGDRQVPISTGVAQARTAGLLGSWLRDPDIDEEHGGRALFVPDARYGVSVDQHLVDTFVVEGVGRLQRYADHDPVNPNVLYDPDDISDGTASFSCGSEDWSAVNGENECPDDVEGQDVYFDVPGPAEGDALRLDRPRGDGTNDGVRIPLLRPAGQHGIYNAQPFRPFDADAYMVNFTVRWLGSRGAVSTHEEACDCTASGLPNFVVDGEQATPSRGEVCTEDDLRVCDATCADAWGIVTPAASTCDTRP